MLSKSHARAVRIILMLTVHFIYVSGHGWMQDPVPMSGGGAGSGNASTRGPCGKTTNGLPATPVTLDAGSTATVRYKRANNHGTTAASVDFTLSYTAGAVTDPSQLTNAMFTPDNTNVYLVRDNAIMDVTERDTQTTTITVPSKTGLAMLQFHWTPTSGGNWYDCALVNVVQAGPCATNNGGCNSNAQCAGNGASAGQCTCVAGFFGSGIGANGCQPVEADVNMELIVHADTTQSGFQDTFTTITAQLTGLPEGRILYDAATLDTSSNSSDYIVTFALAANPEDGKAAMPQAMDLRNMVARGDQALATTYGYPVVAAKGPNDPQAVSFGSDPNAGVLNGDDHGTAILAVVVVVTCLVLAGVGFLSHQKKHGKGPLFSGKSSAFSGNVGSSSSPTAAQTQKMPTTLAHVQVQEEEGPREGPGSDLGYTGEVAVSHAQLPSGWAEFVDETSGHPYYYNESTGETSWEIPQ